MNCNPRLNAINFVFQLEILNCADNLPINLSRSLTKKIYFKKPDGTVLAKDGVFETDGSDALISYTTVSGDLDSLGVWRVQYAVDLPNFSSGTNIETFSVEANIF